MVRINDQHLSRLLQEDIKANSLEGVSKEVVKLYLDSKSTDEKFVGRLVDSVARQESPTTNEWKEQFIEMIKRLHSYESLLYSMRGYRDHIAHAVRVCLLGYYLMTRPPLQDSLKGKPEDIQTKWLLSSLFHDICIPLSRLTDVQTMVRDMMNSYPGIEYAQQTGFAMKPTVFPSIKRVLQKAGTDFCLDLVEHASRGEHGALGGIVILQTFFGHIDDAFLADIVSSIHMHDSRSNCRVDLMEHPLAGLLVICDELQEWDRPFVDRKDNKRILKLDYIDLELRNTSIQAKLDYSSPTSVNGYISNGINEIENFKMKAENLQRLSTPFDLLVHAKDRNGNNAVLHPKPDIARA